MTRLSYREVLSASRRLEGVVVYRYMEGDGPWLILKIDNRLVRVPDQVNTQSALVDFVCRHRTIQLIAATEPTAEHVLEELL